MPPCCIVSRTLRIEKIERTENFRAMFLQTCAQVCESHASEVKPRETTGRGRGCHCTDRLRIDDRTRRVHRLHDQQA
jgi:hypothetical protein